MLTRRRSRLYSPPLLTKYVTPLVWMKRRMCGTGMVVVDRTSLMMLALEISSQRQVCCNSHDERSAEFIVLFASIRKIPTR
jgi:hypothetical protein